MVYEEELYAERPSIYTRDWSRPTPTELWVFGGGYSGPSLRITGFKTTAESILNVEAYQGFKRLLSLGRTAWGIIAPPRNLRPHSVGALPIAAALVGTQGPTCIQASQDGRVTPVH